jgi:hypothetical protein
MKATVWPTEEMYDFPARVGADGKVQHVPCRIWQGKTDGGIDVEFYVLSVGPERDEDHALLKLELPKYMTRTRDIYPTAQNLLEQGIDPKSCE